MPSLDDIYHFDAKTFQGKKGFVKDLIQRQFDLNSSGYGNLIEILFTPILGFLWALAIREIVIP